MGGTTPGQRKRNLFTLCVEVSTEQTKLLKACLGDSNGDATDNVDVQDWDWGTWTNPHLIKLVDATQDAYVEYLRADGSTYKLRITQDDHNTNDRHEYFVDTAGADYPVTTLRLLATTL